MRIVVLYCGERHKGGDDRQPRAIDGVQTGSTAPRTASPNSRITRHYIYLIRVPGVGGVPRSITRVIISAGGEGVAAAPYARSSSLGDTVPL